MTHGHCVDQGVGQDLAQYLAFRGYRRSIRPQRPRKTANNGRRRRRCRPAGDKPGRYAAFTRFKNALAANGINYYRLIAVASVDKTARLEANANASLTLYADAKANNDRFAICDKRGNPVWHGRFFATDHDYNGEQSSGEIAAARKAVWLACKVKVTLTLSAI